MSGAKLKDGSDQSLYFADDHPTMPGIFKGMAAILTERGYTQAANLRFECNKFKCPAPPPSTPGTTPNASANFAFLFSRAHSSEHLSIDSAALELDRPVGALVHRAHCTACRIRPHGHVISIGAVQGSDSGQALGA